MALPKHTERGAAEAPVTDLQEAIRRVQRGERVTIRGEGDRQVAALVPLDDLRRLAADDARRERARRDIRAFGDLFAHEDPDDLERRVAAVVAETRAQMRAERDADGG